MKIGMEGGNIKQRQEAIAARNEAARKAEVRAAQALAEKRLPEGSRSAEDILLDEDKNTLLDTAENPQKRAGGKMDLIKEREGKIRGLDVEKNAASIQRLRKEIDEIMKN